MNIDPSDTSMARQLRSILLELARREDSRAADEAAATPYGSPGPATILGHRSAAMLLRAEADHLLAG
ncbi:hypothetical protein FB382_001526 [Nocardioides ginsengisegetis]|uniref:Uncharacterized protein n=1 Tax=Nocardioides ginsengisegetis TaxID=661491 RepID=A0A7W3P919_9ACTN|nr:hypothetical protein [Nocardioides ginsengisegetis]MBA8803235.1 hypothetical protein [Nocardioides ginsengisegetis]